MVVYIRLLSSVEVGTEAVGVVCRWLVGPEELRLNGGYLASLEVGVEAAGVDRGWLVGPERMVVTCSCVASLEAGANTAKKSSLAG